MALEAAVMALIIGYVYKVRPDFLDYQQIDPSRERKAEAV
jgi:hypothetical protein